jgi:hypothetical protein
MKNEMPNSLGWLNMRGTFLKSTLVSGGYIIKINPMARGILIVPLLN